MPAVKLLDQVREQLRLKHYSYRTEETYLHWIKRYILFHHKRHPKEMDAPEINQFLTHLASEKKISASVQNQALSALLFLYRHVLHIELDEASLAEFRPQRTKTIPTVLSKDEVKRVISNLAGVYKLIAQVLPEAVIQPMQLHLKYIQIIHEKDLAIHLPCSEPLPGPAHRNDPPSPLARIHRAESCPASRPPG